jgi:hypothetical protein
VDIPEPLDPPPPPPPPLLPPPPPPPPPPPAPPPRSARPSSPPSSPAPAPSPASASVNGSRPPSPIPTRTPEAQRAQERVQQEVCRSSPRSGSSENGIAAPLAGRDGGRSSWIPDSSSGWRPLVQYHPSSTSGRCPSRPASGAANTIFESCGRDERQRFPIPPSPCPRVPASPRLLVPRRSRLAIGSRPPAANEKCVEPAPRRARVCWLPPEDAAKRSASIFCVGFGRGPVLLPASEGINGLHLP